MSTRFLRLFLSTLVLVLISSGIQAGTYHSGDKKKEKKDDELAFTGQLWWPVPVLLFVGLVLFGLGCQLRNEK